MVMGDAIDARGESVGDHAGGESTESVGAREELEERRRRRRAMFAKRRKRRRHLRQIIDDRQTGPEAEHQRHEHEPKVGEEDERGGSHALARRVEARRGMW